MTDELHIEHNEEIYEGKLYGWRWFLVIHGLWQVAPPMFTAKRYASNRWKDGDSNEHRLLTNYDAMDLFDWNQSDVPPALPGTGGQSNMYPVGGASGFHLFREYRDAVNYAAAPYAVRRSGLTLPRVVEHEMPEHLTEHVINHELHKRIKVTPLLAHVEGSGVVVEHDLGYRAHLMRFVSLYSDGGRRARERLASNIGWPGEISKYRKLRKLPNPAETNLRRLDCE